MEHTRPGGMPLHPAEKQPGDSVCVPESNFFPRRAERNTRHKEAGETPVGRMALR